MTLRFALLLALLVTQCPAWAHKASDSYLIVDADGAALSAQWDIALRDIDFALGLDGDGNGEITWGELRTRRTAVEAWALSRLEFARGGRCALRPIGLQVDTHSDGGYAVLQLDGTCPQAAGELEVRYRLLFDLDGLHRGLLRLTVDGTAHSAVLGPQSGTQRFSAEAPSRLTQFRQYLVEGIWHIWIGFDHILFLVALLLPAVLVRTAGGWRGADRLGDTLREVLWVVTAFTVAHSVTLSAAVLGWIALPSRLVESAIALSVALAAANNLWPVVERRRWVVAFCFGLIHGFGFASVLVELGLAPGALLLSLFAFNVGVELGQLAIVTAAVPAAFALRNTGVYRHGVFALGSLLTLCVALIWLAERALNLELVSGFG